MQTALTKPSPTGALKRPHESAADKKHATPGNSRSAARKRGVTERAPVDAPSHTRGSEAEMSLKVRFKRFCVLVSGGCFGSRPGLERALLLIRAVTGARESAQRSWRVSKASRTRR